MIQLFSLLSRMMMKLANKLIYFIFVLNFNKFQYVHSLSLEHIRFRETIRDISFECYPLTHLTLIECSFRSKQDDILPFLNNI